MIKRPIHLSHDFLAEVLDSSAVAVDATMGNGHDTLFLARWAKLVHAFDVQEQALEKTSQRLAEAGLTNARLHLMTNTRMQRDFHEGRLQLLSQDEYVQIICDQLEIIPNHIIIHRITGDAPRHMLIGPMWSLNKWEVLNAIDQEMERRGSVQGCKNNH